MKPFALSLTLLSPLFAMLPTTEAEAGRFFRRGQCRPACRSICPPTAVHAPPAVATPAPKRDPWRSLYDGESLAGWEIAEEDEFYQHGKIAVKEGVIEIQMGSPSSGIRLADEEGLLRENYELAFDARRIDGVDFFAGVTFPIAEDYCTLIIGGWSGTIVGLSNVDNLAAADNDTTLTRDFETDRWYRIRLRVSQHKVSAWIDAEQIVDLPRKDRKFAIWWEQEPMRPLGIANWYTASQLRDIKVRPLEPEEIAADAP